MGVGAAWRWHHLSTRPLHADEAVQAWQTWQLLRGEGYRYDPVDRHGPLLYYGAAALERVRGGDATTLNDTRVRTFVWIAGALTLLLVALVAQRTLDGWTAFFATAILAVSPLAVLYHTYFVQEAWLALFTWALLGVSAAWLHRPQVWSAVSAGVLVGLIQSTKETAVLHYAAIALALGLSFRGWWRRPATEADAEKIGFRRRLVSHGALALVAAGVVYAAFYSSFGRNPGGIWDGARTYFHQWSRAGDTDHTYPFLHYVHLLWPHSSGGVPWGEPLLLAFAFAGVILAFRSNAPRALRLVAACTCALLLIYSLIPYKTPWLLLTPIVGLCVLAGHGIFALRHVHRHGFALAVAAALATTAQLAGRTQRSLDRYPGDERNPYFYQQAPRGFHRLVQRIEELAATRPKEAPLTLAVVSPDYAWPLPWYLREHPSTGFFTSPPPAEFRYDVLIWDSRISVDTEWPEDAVVELHGLRPNVLLYLMIPASLWQEWEARR